MERARSLYRKKDNIPDTVSIMLTLKTLGAKLNASPGSISGELSIY